MSDTKYSYPDVAERIRWHRAYLGLTQAKYAARINASRDQVKQWELGRSRPAVDYALEMRRNFGLSLEWLYAGGEAGMPSDLLVAWRSRSGTPVRPPIAH